MQSGPITVDGRHYFSLPLLTPAHFRSYPPIYANFLKLDMVNQCFCGKTCEEILSLLERLALQVQEKWVEEAITSMKSANPLGLKRLERVGPKVSSNVLRLNTLGSRAMLIDKDKKPQWVPSKLEDVSDEMVARCLARSFTEDDDWLPWQLPSRSNRTDVLASKL
ncbi:hypothetical protein L1987_70346 [Smallanthus sonchifolius]|uniref:Uncharacterized protein n=1 Tax=Smallanthus sonchifolius TaxID=185202 RepID=A0ACB9APE7_9ASTR|nr:hypothetical protein L1987_70346 [Smallanthus sonchifolius]